MPTLARKLLIFAAVDGLTLQPLSQRGQKPAPSATILYGGCKVTSSSEIEGGNGSSGDTGDASGKGSGKEVEGIGEKPQGFEAWGVIGEYSGCLYCGCFWKNIVTN